MEVLDWTALCSKMFLIFYPCNVLKWGDQNTAVYISEHHIIQRISKVIFILQLQACFRSVCTSWFISQLSQFPEVL